MSADVVNRPGLSQLDYRIGAFGSFFAAMKGRLASADYPGLAALTTRNGSDPSIALLDAWAIVADILTFYQERIANEGFLRTATEKRSVFELARLLGYKPRPGVAASVFLAYSLERTAQLTIEKGRRSQSVAGDGELPQTYETSEKLVARAEWNNLAPRPSIPQTIDDDTVVVFFKGANLGLKPNDPLLLVRKSQKGDQPHRFVRIQSVDESFEKGFTKVALQSLRAILSGAAPVSSAATSVSATALAPAQPLQGGTAGTAVAPRSFQAVRTSPLTASSLSDVLAELDPRVPLDQLHAVAAHAEVSPPLDVEVYAFRVHTAPFGHNASKRPLFEADKDGNNRTLIGYREWPLGHSDDPAFAPVAAKPPAGMIGIEESHAITLDSAHETIVPGSWVVIVRPNELVPFVFKASGVEGVSRSDYGVTSPATRIILELAPNTLGWLEPELTALAKRKRDGGNSAALTTDGTASDPPSLDSIRKTLVYAQSERLELSESPLTELVGGDGDNIELDGYYAGIDEGRWLIVEGELADLVSALPTSHQVTRTNETGEPLETPSSGVKTAEIVRVAAVTREGNGPGDTPHARVTVCPRLAHAYKRDTVTIYGNVVPATHGDTRKEVLGSGDATKSYQTFALRQGPLTFVPSPTAAGASSTLELRVNDIAWHEVDSLLDARADERVFVAEVDDKGGARVLFGDGSKGARVPTGVENVTAQYRVGIGAAGNVRAGGISQLLDRPPGAKEVCNPLPAEGGADPDTAEQARDIGPLSVRALDRLVSVSDYRDFAQLFAGIAKATVSEEWTGAQVRIVVTVAAAGGLPIARSELQRSLLSAMRQLGDPSRLVEVVDFDRHILVLAARVRLQADYLFESVQPKLQSALVDAFGFARRRLGDDLPLAAVVAVMHGVQGVHSVVVDVFATISSADVAKEEDVTTMAALSGTTLPPERLPIHPVKSGSLVYLAPGVRGSLRLKEMS